MPRQYPQSIDHYYWLTAILSARGMRAKTCRVVAAVILALGTIPLMLMASAVGPHGLRNQTVAVLVAVCCLVMGSWWLRRWWPTRIESQLCVVVGTVCIAVACLIQSHPVVGLVGSATFAPLSAFIAFFHSGRLLAFTWTIGAATLCLLALRLAATDTALAVCIVAVVGLVNVFVAFACRMGIRLIETEVRYGEIEPLTGLLNREGFFDRIATLIGARRRDDDHQLVVMVINLDSFSLLTGMTGATEGNRARVAVGQLLRETVRRDAIVAHIGDAEFLVAEPFTTLDPSPLVDRVRGAIKGPPFRLTASIGVVATPLRPLASLPPDDVIEELLTHATTAMHAARKAGGNQTRLVLNPPLAILNDPDDDLPLLDKPA
jgi:diguanylate cyclase (GGDEF)-like protein